jgi:phage terminase large subunit
LNIDVNLTKKQTIAFKYLNDNITTEVLFGGSAGGGKSFFGCAWLILNCINYPGTRWLMGRSKLKALKQTTLNTFFEVCSTWKLNETHYNYNAQSGEITFYNGSVIILKDLFLYPSDPNFDSLGSLEITGAFIDEVNQITEKAKNIVSSRIRFKLDKYKLIPKLLMSCNPAKNWVFDKFYKRAKDNSLEDYKKFIPALVTDNPNISKHYINQLHKLDEISKRRLLLGEWEYEDKDALINYDNILDIFKDYDFNDEIKNSNCFISCDVARKGKDKAVIIVWFNYKVIEIHTLDISLINEIVSLITSLKNKFKISNRSIVIDGDGVGGGVVDYLPGCVDFVNNSKALKDENYQNLKTQCYFKLAEKINNKELEVFNWDLDVKSKLIQELQLIKRKNVDKDGKLQIISKEEIKLMIGRSPDYSDALMMRMYFEWKKTGPVPFKIG